MTNFNFSKPTPVKTNEKKVPWWEKIWAGLSLISIFGDTIIPKKKREFIPIAVRNIAIAILIIIIIYLVACGSIMNSRWIIDYTKGVSFSLGDRFYYFGIVTILFLIIDCFYMDEKLLDHANKNKMIKNTVNNLSKGIASMPSSKSATKNKFLLIITPICTFLTFLWLIWGIIFYDRILFSGLIGSTILFAIITGAIKNVKFTKYIFFIEILVNILSILFILINHFYFKIIL